VVAGTEALDCANTRHDEVARLEENLGAVNVELTTDDLRDIEKGASGIEVKGARLPETVLKYSNR
jgi:hypothetical protein